MRRRPRSAAMALGQSRRRPVMSRMLLLAVFLLQTATGEDLPRRLRRRRTKSTVPPDAAGGSSLGLSGGIDSGARFRVRLVDSGTYLRCSEGAVTTGRFFFTLIEVRRLPNTDAVLLLCHGVGPLGLGPGDELTDGKPRLAVAGPSSPPQQFWMQPVKNGHTLLLKPTGQSHLRAVESRKGAGQLVAANATRTDASDVAIVKLEAVLAPTKERVERSDARPGSFLRKVRRSVMSVEGKQIVLATYHNLGMMGWSVLFWQWLVASNVPKLLLLDLDGLTCAAAEPLREAHAPGLRIACASVAEMALPAVNLGEAGAVQEWSTRSNGGCKLPWAQTSEWQIDAQSAAHPF